jgi:hypothetical protein
MGFSFAHFKSPMQVKHRETNEPRSASCKCIPPRVQRFSNSNISNRESMNAADGSLSFIPLIPSITGSNRFFATDAGDARDKDEIDKRSHSLFFLCGLSFSPLLRDGFFFRNELYQALYRTTVRPCSTLLAKDAVD